MLTTVKLLLYTPLEFCPHIYVGPNSPSLHFLSAKNATEDDLERFRPKLRSVLLIARLNSTEIHTLCIWDVLSSTCWQTGMAQNG